MFVTPPPPPPTKLFVSTPYIYDVETTIVAITGLKCTLSVLRQNVEATFTDAALLSAL